MWRNTGKGDDMIRIRYEPDADLLFLVLRDDPPVDAVEEPGGVIVRYGEDEEPVSVELLNASTLNLIRDGEVSVTLQRESARRAT